MNEIHVLSARVAAQTEYTLGRFDSKRDAKTAMDGIEENECIVVEDGDGNDCLQYLDELTDFVIRSLTGGDWEWEMEEVTINE